MANLFLTGSGVPTNAVGEVSDYYRDTATNLIYYRAALGWEVVPSLVPTPDGVGTNWLFGTGAPDNGIGSANDYYRDDANGSVYRKHAVNGWEAKGSLDFIGVYGVQWGEGTGAPANIPSLNNLPAGSFYLDVVTSDIYYKDNTLTWSNKGQLGLGSTGLDAVATAADRVQTGLDRVQTTADRVQTGLDAVATAADRVQTTADAATTIADRVQTGLDVIATALSETNAAASKTAAETYAATAATSAKYFDTIVLGLAAVADGATFGVKAGGSDGFTRPQLFRRDSVSTYTNILEQINASEFDSAFANLSNEPTYAIVELDSQGRMSRYVDATGKTWLLLHEDVVLAGAQVANLPLGSLASDVTDLLLPSGSSFLTDGVDPLCFTDAAGRKSELTIDASGRFPEWVARAIAARAVSTVRPLQNTILPRVYTDCTGLANGATVPIDTGQSSTSFGNAPLSVVSGAVVHSQVVGSNNAGYLEVPLTGTVTRIGAAVKFPVGSENSTVDLVLPVSSWAATFGGASAAGVHFVLLGSGSWHCSYWKAGESYYMQGVIDNICDNATRYIDIQVSGNTVTIKLPDGSIAIATDSRVSGAISNLAIWELYESGVEANRASIVAMWADCAALAAPLRDTRPMALAINNFILT